MIKKKNMKATIYFETGNLSLYGKGTWKVTKKFADQRHLDNFIAYIMRTKGYLLDEVFIHESITVKSMKK